jgi:hypothetical protein
MARKSVNVGDQLGGARRRRRAAYAGAERDTDAGRLALERSEHEFAVDIAVEAGPVQIGQIFPDQGGGIGHVGGGVGLARGEAVEGAGEIAIELGLASCGDVELIHGNNPRRTELA